MKKQAAAPSKGIVSRIAARFQFIPEVISELRKVVWPSRRTTLYLTVLVLLTAIVVGAILGAADYGFSTLVEKVFLWGK